MIKRTLFFGNPAYLSLANKQLAIKLPQVEKNETLNEDYKMQMKAIIQIEDIKVGTLGNQHVTITHTMLINQMHYNAAEITCDGSHNPKGLLMRLKLNTLQTEKFKAQIEVSVPFKKILWQKIVFN